MKTSASPVLRSRGGVVLVACVLVVLVAAPAVAQSATQQPVLDGIAAQYRDAARLWRPRLLPVAQQLFMVLAGIEFAVSGALWALRRDSLDDIAAKFGGVIKINRIDRANGSRPNRFRFDPRVQSGKRKNRELGARVAAIQIFRCVRLGIASRLRFFQRFAKRDSRIFDAAQNVVAGSVQNSGDAVQSVPAQAGTQRRKNRHSTRHRRAELYLASIAAR